ncbi:4'-phosphopantetheinyl transferase family protein [Spirilliplanes yamanashiensis]|uniref:4'-phosphopantetheinyl transferase n=1 Tax=Spirilliplanes yamanashiensis TaxID=42233 RepID=A0A8J3Y5P7_9ACTN|nr:4'-phosphopantetheinyl transferase superfamily protein [Spirilliplanes yamanashiensis]MDP9819324.1 4'-phosphopantetheinyl transferase EntD [Spirilliplanes yamanashiensis]GIJ01853.1 4'-phosphopantetheinyl transferase [Spirilliplanes yamanashiensis]
MIAAILPAGVAAAEAFDDEAPAALFPGEEALVAGALPRRVREFGTTRACARRALAQLGLPPAAVLRGAGRAPAWPTGVVGSLTHCDGYRAAAVARATDLTALGIDAEPAEPLPPGVLSLVASAGEEQPHLRELADGHPGVPWDRLLFCAKEAVFKAWSPLTGRWLGCAEAHVTIDPAGTFRARLRPEGGPGPVAAFDGRWLAARGLLVAAVTL